MPRKQKTPEEDAEAAGPGKVIARVAGGVGGIVVVTVVLTLLVIALGNVTGGWRIAVAGLMGLGIAKIGIGYFSYLTHPPPPDLPPMKVDPQLRLSYLCEMCGLELAVVAVAKERAPKHCGESMVLVQREE
jgi:hypothetical protein